MSIQTYHYKPLGWAGKLYGGLFILAGLFLNYLFIQEIMHRANNLGGDTLFRDPVDMALWIGLVVIAELVTLIGWLLFFSERETVVDDSTITVRDFKGLRTRHFTNSTIENITAQPQTLFGVFGGGGMPMRTTELGTQYGVVLHIRGKRRPITLFASRDQNISNEIVNKLKQSYPVNSSLNRP